MPDLDPDARDRTGAKSSVVHETRIKRQAQLELRLRFRLHHRQRFPLSARVGWMLQPQLNLDVQNVLDQTGWNLGMAVGPLLPTGVTAEYFYGVDAILCAHRPARYSASGGYAGSQFVAALTKRFRNSGERICEVGYAARAAFDPARWLKASNCHHQDCDHLDIC